MDSVLRARSPVVQWGERGLVRYVTVSESEGGSESPRSIRAKTLRLTQGENQERKNWAAFKGFGNERRLMRRMSLWEGCKLWRKRTETTIERNYKAGMMNMREARDHWATWDPMQTNHITKREKCFFTPPLCTLSSYFFGHDCCWLAPCHHVACEA